MVSSPPASAALRIRLRKTCTRRSGATHTEGRAGSTAFSTRMRCTTGLCRARFTAVSTRSLSEAWLSIAGAGRVSCVRSCRIRPIRSTWTSMFSRPSRIAGSEARAMRNCASDEMQVSGFPTSCATPAASSPAAASRSERTTCSCSLRSDVTSFTTARMPLTSSAAPRARAHRQLGLIVFHPAGADEPCAKSPEVLWSAGPESADRSADQLAVVVPEHALPTLAHESDATERIQGHDCVHRAGDQVLEVFLRVLRLAEKARILQSDGGMVGKGAQANDVLLCEWADFLVTYEEDSDYAAAVLERYARQVAHA